MSHAILPQPNEGSEHVTMSSRNSSSPNSARVSMSRDRETILHVDDEEEEEAEEEDDEDIFNIPPKDSSVDRLQKWRQATLVLNASRRFRYTANLKQEGKDLANGPLKRFRTSAHALRAVNRFKLAGANIATTVEDDPLPEGFELGPTKLINLFAEHNYDMLQHLGGIQGLANRLQTDVDKGIRDDPQEIQMRKTAFGENTYPRSPPRKFWVFAWEACQDTTLIILMVCAVLSLIFGIKSDGIKEGWYDGASIAFAVILVILVTAISDYKQSLRFQALNEEKKNIKVEVVRGGRRFLISIYELVVGDVVPLSTGNQVPGDGLMISGHSLTLDESSMTGESEPVHIHQKHPFLMSGCKVADGFGLMLVTGVGTNTEWGRLMASISDDISEETPLQVRLNGVATFIGQIGLSVAVMVFIILMAFYFSGHKSVSKNKKKFQAGQTSASDAVNGVVDIFAIAVTIVVVAVPEGLPLAVTLTLAYSMRKMMADKALVRRLSACETMGSATTICTDKTGTLTLNQMSVVKSWVAGDMKESAATVRELSSNVLALLLEGVGQNSNGSVFVPENGKEAEVTGSPTEKAILSWALEIGMDFNAVRSKSSILQVETFNSEKKRAGVAVEVVENGEVHLHWKGAAELILKDCDKWLCADGSIHSITEHTRSELQDAIGKMAADSLRCVALAYRGIACDEVLKEKQQQSWKIPDIELILIAIVGIKDPCRPGVGDAVMLCQAAGVKVRMVTGDNPFTARAIAEECGILQGKEPIEGFTFRNLTPKARKEALPEITVMARSSPTDKLLLVKTLREMGEVVAVTGDGTNDAPALHEADVGLSMGIQGTEVAKESSDIIILDDNFSSVVKVVRWGRSVYFNIQKFIQFQLTVNVAALVINFVAAVSSGSVPLTVVQLLWVNLIMDTLGALALATEPPTDILMQRPPVGRREPLITNVMWRNIFGQALYQVAILLTLQFRGKDILNLRGPDSDTKKNTIIFNSFVLCQIFNEINARKPEELNIFKGFFNNYLFVGIVTGTLILQVIIVEFLKNFASTTKLTWQQWLICVGIGFLSWPIAFIVKFIPVPQKPIIKTNVRFLGRRSRKQASTKRQQSSKPKTEDSFSKANGNVYGQTMKNS